MAISPLDPESLPRKDRILGKGHGIAALGPSDSSDSGSDLIGAPGLAIDPEGLGAGDDSEGSMEFMTAGPDVGDANLDSDSDRFGTGERASASRDTVTDGADIAPDRIIVIPDDLDDDQP